MGEISSLKAKNKATAYAILAAALYAVNVPLSKLLLNNVEPTMMASFLYLGAGIGLFLYGYIEQKLGKAEQKEKLTKKELPFTIAMVLLDIAAPIFLMIGITMTNSANVSLLNNFEIVVTSMIALVVFKEVISRRLWFAIVLVTLASAVLSFEGVDSFIFNKGSLFVLGACLCWGLENNCTRMISNKNSIEIVVIKGTFSGFGSMIVAFILGEQIPELVWVFCVLFLGFVAYGLSIHFYIMAQKDLGAAKTSAYYSIAPFFGVAFSMLLLGERPEIQFYVAFLIMIISTYFMIKDTIELQHTHEHGHTHVHTHCHGELSHTHEHTHMHTHIHIHGEDCESHTHGDGAEADKEYLHYHTEHTHNHHTE